MEEFLIRDLPSSKDKAFENTAAATVCLFSLKCPQSYIRDSKHQKQPREVIAEAIFESIWLKASYARMVDITQIHQRFKSR